MLIKLNLNLNSTRPLSLLPHSLLSLCDLLVPLRSSEVSPLLPPSASLPLSHCCAVEVEVERLITATHGGPLSLHPLLPLDARRLLSSSRVQSCGGRCTVESV